jgi:hypothetical protein
MKLRELALTRSGDKENISNIGVVPYHETDYDLLREKLTVDLVRQKFGPLVKGTITRYEMPGPKCLNFVMHEALEGGVSYSLRTDPHGKSYQSLMLDIDIDTDTDTPPTPQ